jgi:hypothetical protein
MLTMPSDPEIMDEGRRKLMDLEEQLREAEKKLQEAQEKTPRPGLPNVVNQMAEFQETIIKGIKANIAAVEGALKTLEDLDES